MERAIISFDGFGTNFIPSTIFLMGLCVCFAINEDSTDPQASLFVLFFTGESITRLVPLSKSDITE